jgi:hypothetical protein
MSGEPTPKLALLFSYIIHLLKDWWWTGGYLLPLYLSPGPEAVHMWMTQRAGLLLWCLWAAWCRSRSDWRVNSVSVLKPISGGVGCWGVYRKWNKLALNEAGKGPLLYYCHPLRWTAWLWGLRDSIHHDPPAFLFLRHLCVYSVPRTSCAFMVALKLFLDW